MGNLPHADVFTMGEAILSSRRTRQGPGRSEMTQLRSWGNVLLHDDQVGEMRGKGRHAGE